MKKKLFIFDVDGTLVNSRAGTVLAYVETFKECFGKDISETELYPFAGSHFDFMLSEFIGECSAENLKKAGFTNFGGLVLLQLYFLNVFFFYS